MNSEMFRLNLRDVFKGLVSAVVGGVAVAVIGVFQGIFSTPGFDVFSADWAGIWHNVVNISFIAANGAFWGYLGKNLITAPDGKIAGKY